MMSVCYQKEIFEIFDKDAGMAKWGDAPGLSPGDQFGYVGSSPTSRTKK